MDTMLNILKRSTAVHLGFAISYFLSGLVLNFIQIILYCCLKPFNKSLFRKINYYLCYSFSSRKYFIACLIIQRFVKKILMLVTYTFFTILELVFMSQWWSRSKLSIYIKKDEYEKYYGKEHGYLLMNHSYEIDWLMGWHFCEGIGVLGVSLFVCTIW